MQEVCGALSCSSAVSVFAKFPELWQWPRPFLSTPRARYGLVRAPWLDYFRCKSRRFDKPFCIVNTRTYIRYCKVVYCFSVDLLHRHATCAELFPLGPDNKNAQHVLVHMFANGCDLLRNVPAFRTGQLGCPMTAVLRLYARTELFVANASPSCLLLP